MRIYWWKTPKGITKNFGDQLNPYLFFKMTGKKAEYGVPSPDTTTILAIGSVLGMFMNQLSHCVIWGSGFGRMPSKLKCFLKNEKMTIPQKIFAVRGPLTQKAFSSFNINCPNIYGDPALLVPRYFNPAINNKYEIGVIPHYSEYNHSWVNGIKNEDTLIVNVNDPVEEVIQKIVSCKKIISSSLHGLIIADAYQIPSVWITITEHLKRQSFKFYDYYYSIGYDEARTIIVKKDTTLAELSKQTCTHKISLNLDKLIEVCPYFSQ